jgi:galactokinase
VANLLENALDTFKERYSRQADCIVQAPGRVNLIGEHTDYNDGFVLPCAINFQTLVAGAIRDDGLIRVTALDYGCEQDEFAVHEPIAFNKRLIWSNYIRGVIAILGQRGYKIAGADLVVTGNVPQGAGLSSSASLEVAVIQAIMALNNLTVGKEDIARIAQQAENDFVGINCGIMDQMISVLGKENHALLIDCKDLATKPVSIPQNTSIVIINSNKQRGLVDSAYNERREQCEYAAGIFGADSLREVSLDQLEHAEAKLDGLVFRRARHVLTENERVQFAVNVLEANDLEALGHLMEASHNSMRDDFEITVPEIDLLVEIVKSSLGDKGGVRMTGGGFGGCVVAVVPDTLVDRVVTAVETEYETKSGLKESIYVCTASEGAGRVMG